MIGCSFCRTAGNALLLAVALQNVHAADAPPETGGRIVDVTFPSESLGRDKTYTVVTPSGGGTAPVLFLLHGRGRNHRSLIERDDTRLALLAQNYYIVLPDGEDGWYVDSPVDPTGRYEHYLEEVIRSAEDRFPLRRDPAGRALAGWSMGGYGAVHFAESHPGKFAAVVGIVGLLDFPRLETLPDGRNYHVPVKRFGDDPAVWAAFNPIRHIDRLAGMQLLMITGLQSFDLVMNRNFVAHARAQGFDCGLVELSGGHTIETVAEAVPLALRFVSESFAVPMAGAVRNVSALSGEIAPLPAGRRADQYASRDEFLTCAAGFETARLRAQPWRFDGEEAFFASGDLQVVPVRDGLALRFRRVRAAEFAEGITPELKDQLLDVPNRNRDQRRWADMFDPARHDRTRVDYDFFISDEIVSNAVFATFVRATGYRTTVERYATGWIVDPDGKWRQGFANAWDQQIYPTSEPDHPVVQVSWFDAMEFAAWLNTRTGIALRVPTKEEWLLAARPADATTVPRLFPWGNALNDPDRRMNFGTAELAGYAWIHEQFHDGFARSSPVGAFPPTARGLHDMLGNVWVWNWTSAVTYKNRALGERVARPSPLADLGVGGNAPMTMTGGCYLARLSHANLLAQMSHPALDGAEDIGFRLVAVRRRESGL
jgi:formylglycine-generating enzyme required for sulfatase activity/S-formylglutathione hydrolase FrmB